MHVGFTSDEGGNTVELRWFRHKSNLHHVSTVNDQASAYAVSRSGSFPVQIILQGQCPFSFSFFL
jgi:hypothetical protein